jgi:hypothetical protein
MKFPLGNTPLPFRNPTRRHGKSQDNTSSKNYYKQPDS